MGIKHFFQWFKRTYPTCYREIRINEPLSVGIDVLCLDLNGIFHASAQKVYRYGKHADKRILPKSSNEYPKDIKVFYDVTKTIDSLVRQVNPTSKLVLCVDGVAGMAKMVQQRQRRFRSAVENSGIGFDSNCITPGTQFMDKLSKFIAVHIENQMRDDDHWASLEVFFSNEKVPGEGEKKIINYLRHRCEPTNTICFHGMDADLFMLGLALGYPNVYILRDDNWDARRQYEISINTFIQGLPIPREDFVFLCFLVGNDFLPNLPGMEIYQGGIEGMLSIYTEPLINPDTLEIYLEPFFKYIGRLREVCLDCLKKKFTCSRMIPDPLLQRYFRLEDGVVQVDFRGFREAYYQAKFGSTEDINTICKEYILGMQWVIQEYFRGMPSWSWCYPYLYAPLVDDLADTVGYRFGGFEPSKPYLPFQQLMCVLPSKSSGLLPPPLSDLLSPTSELGEYFPDNFEIDTAGKYADWEGIIKIPPMNIQKMLTAYDRTIGRVSAQDQRRNYLGREFLYRCG
jgi:5'-3' exoribonuclease 1